VVGIGDGTDTGETDMSRANALLGPHSGHRPTKSAPTGPFPWRRLRPRSGTRDEARSCDKAHGGHAFRPLWGLSWLAGSWWVSGAGTCGR
jgi:hypothetical protein